MSRVYSGDRQIRYTYFVVVYLEDKAKAKASRGLNVVE